MPGPPEAALVVGLVPADRDQSFRQLHRDRSELRAPLLTGGGRDGSPLYSTVLHTNSRREVRKNISSSSCRQGGGRRRRLLLLSSLKQGDQSATQTHRERSGKISLPPPADKEEGEGGGFSSSPPSLNSTQLGFPA